MNNAGRSIRGFKCLYATQKQSFCLHQEGRIAILPSWIAPSRKVSGNRCGFTLIEILVVILIISIVTSVALLSISRNENRQLETFTKDLVQTLTLAQEQAMLQPAVLGLAIERHTYQFAARPKTRKKVVGCLLKINCWEFTVFQIVVN